MASRRRNKTNKTKKNKRIRRRGGAMSITDYERTVREQLDQPNITPDQSRHILESLYTEALLVKDREFQEITSKPGFFGSTFSETLEQHNKYKTDLTNLTMGIWNGLDKGTLYKNPKYNASLYKHDPHQINA